MKKSLLRFFCSLGAGGVMVSVGAFAIHLRGQGIFFPGLILPWLLFSAALWDFFNGKNRVETAEST